MIPNSPTEGDQQYQQLDEGFELTSFLEATEGKELPPQTLVDHSLKVPRIEEWSIFSTQPRYFPPEYKEGITVFPSSGIAALKLSQETDPPKEPPQVQEESEDYFDGVHPCLSQEHFFATSIDMSVTYLGSLNQEQTQMGTESFSINTQCITQGELCDKTPFKLLVDTGASKCFMSKSFYDKSTLIQRAPRIPVTGGHVKVGDDRKIPILFVVPVVISVQGHMFEIFCMVADLGFSNDIILGLKGLMEIEGVIDVSQLMVKFRNRALPLYPCQNTTIPVGAKRSVKIKTCFSSELSGIAVLKLMLHNVCYTVQAQIKRNLTVIDITNTSDKPIELKIDHQMGCLDARSMGYYCIDQQTLQNQLIPKYEFKYLYQDDSDETFQQMREKHQQDNADPYPWMAPDDPRRNMTDEEILDFTINLKDTCLTEEEKEYIMSIIKEYKAAFSLRDEIGECPNLKIDIEVIDKSPFFVRPFRISEEDKPIMDKQMQRLVCLGILSKNTTSHTSPVMLISRKVTQDKRPIVDFRLLNTRILRRNNASPLMKDIRSILGNSKCEVFSCLDLKDAYHSIRLTDQAKEYCGILPYFGSAHYRYEVLPMGLNISPAKWMEYVEVLLEHVENRHNYIVIMDDLLIHSSRAQHFQILEDLFKSLIRCGLKLSPKKCQLFRKKLQYMGNDFEITPNGVTMSILVSRIKALQDLPPPKTPKQCKQFCGVVNYLAEFCPDLQKDLKPIYELTRKNRPFIWTEYHQEAFIKVKSKLMKPPVLACPTSEGRFTLFTDTSRQHVGSCLWQRQKGKNRLIGYASKTLQPACANYGVTELEMHGMVISIKMWALWLGRNEFDCVVDHQAIVQIMKSKDPPASNRIKRYLEELTHFNALYYYLKGKHMIISDFLSRVQWAPPDSWAIEAVGFTPKDILISHIKADQVLILASSPTAKLQITTRRQAAAEGIAVPEVHGADKDLDPHAKPEHQSKYKPTVPQKKVISTKLPSYKQQLARRAIKRSVATLNRPRTPAVPRESLPQQPAPSDQPDFPEPTEDMAIPDQPVKPPPVQQSRPQQIVKPQPQEYRPESTGEYPMPVAIKDIIPSPTGLETDGKPTAEGATAYHRVPKDSDFEVPPALAERVKEDEITSKFLPRQVDLDKVIAAVQKKVLRKVHFPVTMKDMQAAYLKSPFFRDIFIYLAQNKVPTQMRRLQRINACAYNYILMDCLLFKLEPDSTNEPVAKLCIPDSKIDMLLQHYHSSVMGGHQGVTKTVLSIRQLFFCPRLTEHVQAYILGCHACQMFKKGQQFQRPFLKRLHQGATSFSRISMDVKYMPSSGPYKFMLVVLCEMTNFINCVPLSAVTAEQVCSALVDHHFKYFGPPQYLICDKDPAFMSKVAQALFKHLEIQVITVGPTNHQSLQAEHGIKSISQIITKTLADKGGHWHRYLAMSQLAYNSKVSSNMDNLSPFQMVFGHPAKTNPGMNITPEVEIPLTHRQYYSDLVRKLSHYKQNLIQFRDVKQDLRNKDREYHHFQVGDLVYLYEPRGATLQTGSKKIACYFVGPLVVYKAISPRQFFLMSLDGIVYPHIIEETRIKPGYVYTTNGIVSTLSELKKVLRAGLAVTPVKSV